MSIVKRSAAELVGTFWLVLGRPSRPSPSVRVSGIAVPYLSVNPARSAGFTVFVQGWPLAQLWLFWLAPMLG